MMESGAGITLFVSLVAGLAAGFVMHRSDFCLAGMVRDLFLFRSTFMLRIFALYLLVNMLLTEFSRELGLLPLFPYPLFGLPGLANVIGGALFGIGMVLAGGCVVGTLYRMGAGSILSLTAFAGLVTGSALYAEIHGWWKAVAGKMQFTAGKVTMAQMLGVNQAFMVLPLALLLLWAIRCWRKNGVLERRTAIEGYLQPWKAAILLALITWASALLIGMPLGITTCYAKMGAWLEMQLFPVHAAGVEYFKAMPLNYVNPLFRVAYQGGPGWKADGIAMIQFPLVAGIVFGSFISARLLGEFRIYARVPAVQYFSALLGGIIMGLAARMAPSCNVWHLLGGIPVLATQSILFVAGLLPGAWLGARVMSSIVLRGR